MWWEDIVRIVVSNGCWAAVACGLLFYLIKDSKKREQRYTALIQDLATRLTQVEQIKENTDKILTFVSARAAEKPAPEKEKSDSAKKTVRVKKLRLAIAEPIREGAAI
ncbi:MAG: BhlA/UviB family holin-like peptide [Firmicutes bacterium]|nr:BhlA/UviB family holin-like peptide [Bacillota bacterium]